MSGSDLGTASKLSIRTTPEQPDGQPPAVEEEEKSWTGLTEEKQRELQMMANSTRIQVQKSVRDLTSDIRQLRHALETSQRNGENLQGVEAIIAAGDSTYRHLLAPEENSQGISESNAEEPGDMPAMSNRIPKAASGHSETANAEFNHSLIRHPMKKSSIVSRDNYAGRPTIASQLQSKAVKLVNDGQEMRVARKCEACCRQVTEPESLVTDIRKRQASDERQCHTCGGALPLRKRRSVPSQKRWVLSDGLVGRSAWEPLSLTTVWVAPSSPMLPREQNQSLDTGNHLPHDFSKFRQKNEHIDVSNRSASKGYVNRKQNQGSSENEVPRAKLLETYLEEKGRKEIHKQKAWERSVVLDDDEHPRMKILSGDLHRRFMEKNFAEAVEKYLVKLMTYEANVLRRWFSPTEKLPSLNKEIQLNPAKVHYFRQKWLSPDQLQHLNRQRHIHEPKICYLKEKQEFSTPVSIICSKEDRFTSAEKSLREQRSWNEDSSNHTRIPIRRSHVDKKLNLLTADPADVRFRRRLKDEALNLLIQSRLSAHCRSRTDLVVDDPKCHKKTKLSVKIERIADNLLDEALQELAEELRTWCEKVVDHLISGELGTSIQ